MHGQGDCPQKWGRFLFSVMVVRPPHFDNLDFGLLHQIFWAEEKEKAAIEGELGLNIPHRAEGKNPSFGVSNEGILRNIPI